MRQELFSIGMDAGSPEIQLSHTNGRVWDYQPSPDGESVVFSAINSLKGIDLWMVQRDGSNQHKLLDCGGDRCSSPAWSPLIQELAFTRESIGLAPNGPKGALRIWILDSKTGQAAPLFSDPEKVGDEAKWSPDGQWLSFWNGAQGGIQIVNRKTGTTILLESTNGDSGSWSSDGQYLYYTNLVSERGDFRNTLLRADIRNGAISTILGGNVEGDKFSVGNPVCSPKGKMVVVPLQPDIKMPDKELFFT